MPSLPGFKSCALPFALGGFVIGLCSHLHLAAAVPGPATPAVAGSISFQNDVMAVLSKGGCNSGGCHGNKNGKGGFKLSLRGQDPDGDYQAITADAQARRVNAFEPDLSLLLQKACASVPHEGGRRFDRNSPEYVVLRDWISRNTPRDPEGIVTLKSIAVSPGEQLLAGDSKKFQIRVAARFDDGTTRDVTHMAVYEPSSTSAKASHDGEISLETFGETTVIVRYLQEQQPVRVARIEANPAYRWNGPRPRNEIDRRVFAKLQWLRIPISPEAGDTAFIRRAYLDLTGNLPTAEESRRFAAERSSGKRARLIDQLLERPEFSEFWALKWADLLRAEEKSLDRKGVQHFHEWIRQSLASHKPMDQFVREIVSATGSTYQNPAANFYRANRNPVIRAEAVAQVFLGTRLLCAQCHNHPFDRWSQDDYYDWATVFGRIGYKVLENRKRDSLDSHEFVGEQVVFELREGEVTNARTGKPARPRFLGATGPQHQVDAEHRIDSLAAWITSKDNARFARAQANRIWFHLMGRGLVDPIDDFRPTNPASHPELLDFLASDFVRSGYDLRHLIRLIMNSRSYQTSSDPMPANERDVANYSHSIPRRLAAEQLLDAQQQVLGLPSKFAGYPEGMLARQLPGVSAMPRREMKQSRADKFLVLFGKPERLLTCECERSAETTLGQAFELITGSNLNGLLAARGNRVQRWLDSGIDPREFIRELYWSALSRPPSEQEMEKLLQRLQDVSNRRSVVEDMVWAVLNSKEFLMRY